MHLPVLQCQGYAGECSRTAQITFELYIEREYTNQASSFKLIRWFNLRETQCHTVNLSFESHRNKVPYCEKMHICM